MVFLNSASFAATPVFYLPLCTHTDTEKKKRERQESGIYSKIVEKTQYLMNTFMFKNFSKIYAMEVGTLVHSVKLPKVIAKKRNKKSIH